MNGALRFIRHRAFREADHPGNSGEITVRLVSFTYCATRGRWRTLVAIPRGDPQKASPRPIWPDPRPLNG